ncbi:hypothetical protein RDV89_10395 [Nocardioides zeae]|uniref:Uncharacterized protein n=1 Tax=Nocardioides imazamoxiresistens TaxID=3231893 RepID=A0ABU3PWA4_9ACTN|nr:hypothetical protein [Nocardioides zeae]MDT9593476.1 hypothetical protein [Nocardioides zeae]
MEEHPVEDRRFGALLLGVAPDAVEVRGAQVPTTRIERTGPLDERRDSSRPPIGTRDPAGLVLTADGVPLDLEPGRGRLARGSYRVRVRRDDEAWMLTPSDPYSSRFVRGRRYRGDNELASLTRSPDGTVALAWSETVGRGRFVARAPEPEPLEASLAYALAAAFDTGAELAVVRLVSEGADLLLPG